MLTYLLMVLITIFLVVLLSYRSKYRDDSQHFFDKTNSVALRGFWCMIVILVHTPALYQNKIQDMLGSFAYIGVTFFFMTSAFGLKLGTAKDPNGIKYFWRKRLPQLIIPYFLANIVSCLILLYRGVEFKLDRLWRPNRWVQWLLVCYLIFWFVYRFIPIKEKWRDVIICICIVCFSGTVYRFKNIIEVTTWCTEVYGFIWGIILSNFKGFFVKWMNRCWLVKCVLFCMVSGILGLCYLKYKPVVFYGDYLLKIVLGIAIIIFMLAINTKIEIGNKLNLFLGNISYEIYLLHGAVFGLISYMMPGVDSGVFIIVSIITTILFSAIINKLNILIVRTITKGHKRLQI